MPETADVVYAGWMLPNEDNRCQRFIKRHDASPNTEAMETDT